MMKKNLIIKLMIKFKFERRHPPQGGSLSGATRPRQCQGEKARGEREEDT